MSLTAREFWTVAHGMLLGALFLLAFGGGLAGLYSLRPEWITPEGIKERIGRLKAGTWAMAVIAWATVITGTYLVYPWYRTPAPNGTTDLSAYPKFLLLANKSTAEWHNFGMEWKEHVGWIAPIAATVVAFAISYYGPILTNKLGERRAIIIFFVIAFVAAAIAGMFGAFINKAAPVR